MQVTATENKPVKRGVGRPTKWRPEFIEKAREFVRAGLTREDIAAQFDVHVSQLAIWQNTKPEFFEALNATRAIADTAVASALYLKATGQATKTTRKVITRPDGEKEIHEVTETLGPDAQAARYWLNNRAPKQWRDRIEVSGPDGQPLAVNLSWLQAGRTGRVAGDVVDVTATERPDGPEPQNPALARVSGPRATDNDSDA
jgi:hypothetical protein